MWGLPHWELVVSKCSSFYFRLDHSWSYSVFGASLSKPHTSRTALVTCMCMFACLQLYTVNFKWVHLNISQRLYISCTCSARSQYTAVRWRATARMQHQHKGSPEWRWLKLTQAWQLLTMTDKGRLLTEYQYLDTLCGLSSIMIWHKSGHWYIINYATSTSDWGEWRLFEFYRGSCSASTKCRGWLAIFWGARAAKPKYDVTVSASSILNFSLTIFMSGCYTLPSHPLKLLLALQQQELLTIRKPNVLTISTNITNHCICYDYYSGLLWVVI